MVDNHNQEIKDEPIQLDWSVWGDFWPDGTWSVWAKFSWWRWNSTFKVVDNAKPPIRWVVSKGYSQPIMSWIWLFDNIWSTKDGFVPIKWQIADFFWLKMGVLGWQNFFPTAVKKILASNITTNVALFCLYLLLNSIFFQMKKFLLE